MAEHQVNTASKTNDRGILVFVVRKDEAWNREQLADDDGNFSGLTVDEHGYLRVRSSPESEVTAPSLLHLLIEQNALLRRLVAAAELMNETNIPDPEGDALQG